MRKPIRILTILVITSIISANPFAIPAQSRREVLTNAKIIELAQLGLGDEILVEKIRQSECRCDTSAAALARLKAAKVSNAVMMAMLGSTAGGGDSDQTGSREPVGKPTPNVSTREPKSPEESGALAQISEPGIYLFENEKMTAIEPSVFSGAKMNPLLGTLTYGIKKTKYRAKVRGNSANLKAASSRPVFYFVFNPDYKNSGAAMAGNLWWGMPATSPAEFVLVQMNVKDASREAILGEYGLWTGASMGARDQDIREYAFEKIRPGIYKVVPKAGLAAGEYCFYYAGTVTGIGFAGGKVFDFSLMNGNK
jgi:hypothetical protein